MSINQRTKERKKVMRFSEGQMQSNTSSRKMFLELLVLLDDEQSTQQKPPEKYDEIRDDPGKTSVIKEKGMEFEQEETKKSSMFYSEILSGGWMYRDCTNSWDPK